jgi:hypothetical protein
MQKHAAVGRKGIARHEAGDDWLVHGSFLHKGSQLAFLALDMA